MTAARSVLLLGVFATINPPVGAQTIVPGAWTGVLQLVDGPTVNVVFTVREIEGELEAYMNSEGGPVTPVTDLEISGGDAAFR